MWLPESVNATVSDPRNANVPGASPSPSLSALSVWQPVAESASVVATLIGSAAAGLYPTLLPALPGSAHPGLDIYNAASPDGSLRIALGIYLVGMGIVVTYLWRIYRVWRDR